MTNEIANTEDMLERLAWMIAEEFVETFHLLESLSTAELRHAPPTRKAKRRAIRRPQLQFDSAAA